MAIFHLTGDFVSRKNGQSIIAKAAYNAREELTEERTGEVKDYTRAQGLIFSGIYTPANAPEWAHDRAQLWNAADAAEKRKDARLAETYEVALPHELTNEQRRFLVQDFVRENFVRKGYAVDVAIHAPDREGDERNYHAHILVTERKLTANGFAADKKERQLYKVQLQAELEALRESWEHIANRHLERHGHEARIDRRSLKDQGIDREATEHLGPYATQLERDGEESERGNTNREIEARNREREEAQRDYEAAQAERQQWEEKIAQAAIKKAEAEQKKEREAERDEAKNAELGKATADIRLAVALSPSGESFSAALKERCLVLSQITEQEAAASARAAAFSKEIGQRAPEYRTGELVVINAFGNVHRLTERSTGKTREELDKYLAQVKQEGLPNAEQGKKEAVMLGQYKQRAELLAKQEAQKAALEKQQAERKEAREKQAREFEEKTIQEIDAGLASKHLSDKNRLEKHLKESNSGFFSRTAKRIKQFIGHKIEDHEAEQRKEKLHSAIVENGWKNQDRDEARQARQDKAHERGQATVEIKQAQRRDELGIQAPERDEALKAAQRTNTEKAFSQSAAQTTKPRDNGFPDPKKVAQADRERERPAAPERKESALEKTIEAVGKGREAAGQAATVADKGLRVIDKASGAIGGLSNGVAAILDGIAKPVEAFAEGLCNMFSPPSPAPRLHRREPDPTPDQIRAAERALTNINQSLKRGDDIDAADLRNLPKGTLERIRDGGDEYLMRMCQNWEIQQREREKENERER